MKPFVTKMSVAALAIAALTTTAQAQQTLQQPSFDKLGVSYINYDLEGETLNGAGLQFNRHINQDWFFDVNYIYATDDYTVSGVDVDATANTLYGNLAFKFYQMNNMVAYASAGLVYSEIDVDSGVGSFNEDDTGWNAQIGMRTRITDVFEVDANVRHVDIYDGSDQEWSISGQYYITNEFSLGLGYTLVDSDNSYVALSGNFHF
ncbi:porin family protein [Pseudidiomarina marina]|uniref:outer membrane beta-barrel protein n=1 Tax=Pseudidiomarina marina TaxID=502366 RepID=UPI00384AB4B9